MIQGSSDFVLAQCFIVPDGSIHSCPGNSRAAAGDLRCLCRLSADTLPGPLLLQIIFSSVPLWSALLAVVVLREQPMGMLGWAGGLFIIVGGYFAAEIDKR